MNGKQEEYRPGEQAKEAGAYYCNICHSEGGTHEIHVPLNGEFPQCPSCGEDGLWQKKPMVTTPFAKDPVCGMMVDEKKAAATSEYQGKKYHFCAKGCKVAFDQNPQKYVK